MCSLLLISLCAVTSLVIYTGGVNFSVQVGFGAIAPAHPTRISAASECIGSRYMMYTDTLQPTESMVRRSTDPLLIQLVSPERSQVLCAGDQPRQASLSLTHSSTKSQGRRHNLVTIAAEFAVYVPPPPLLEVVGVLASWAMQSTQLCRHAESTCTRDGHKHVVRG